MYGGADGDLCYRPALIWFMLVRMEIAMLICPKIPIAVAIAVLALLGNASAQIMLPSDQYQMEQMQQEQARQMQQMQDQMEQQRAQQQQQMDDQRYQMEEMQRQQNLQNFNRQMDGTQGR